MVSAKEPHASRARYMLLVPAMLLLLPATLSANVDPIRLVFLLFTVSTGAVSLWMTSREDRKQPHKQGRRAPPADRPSRDAVLDDLRRKASSTPHGAKIQLQDSTEFK